MLVINLIVVCLFIKTKNFSYTRQASYNVSLNFTKKSNINGRFLPKINDNDYPYIDIDITKPWKILQFAANSKETAPTIVSQT